MHFDALTLACVTTELQHTLSGGRVQQVLAPDDHSIGLEIYAQRQRHNLLLAASGSTARAHLVSQKLRRGVEQPSPVLLILRKYVRDSLLAAVEQPDATERVLQLRFEHVEHGTTTLVAELIGRRSNLLLVNPAGKILECLRRIWPGENVTRPLVPGQPYTPPAPQNRLAPLDNGDPDYYDRLGALLKLDGKLWKVLSTHLAGVSPTLGRELAWRTTGDSETVAQAADLMALVQALQALWSPVQTNEWQPGLWYEDGKPVGFSVYPAHIRGEFIPTSSISQALEQFYAQPPDTRKVTSQDAYAGLRTTVAAELRRAQQRLQRQLDALAADEPLPGAAEQMRMQAEWLLALSSQVQPGEPTLDVDLGDSVLSIALDPGKTPVAQAEQMFQRAAKLERAAKFIPERRARLQADLDFLAQLSVDLTLAENQPEIAAVREELNKAGLQAGQQKKTPKERVSQQAAQLRRYYSPQGFEIIVGRNARQNEHVTFDIANGSDLWLHVRGAPGSHVVIRNGGQLVSEETLRMAAQLAAYYSSLRGERAVPVAYTQRRFVSRAPGGRTGQVYVRNEQTITVRAELPEVVRST